MNTITMCSAYDIRQLNETKKYTLVATDLINTLLLDTKLTAGAVKLWQYLYSKAIFNKDLKFSICYQSLSIVFKKSLRTIQRYVANLKENGYVLVEENFNGSGQLANTFHLRFPQHEIDSMLTSKDRYKAITSYKQPASEVSCKKIENQPVAVNDSSTEGNTREEVKNVIPRGDITGIHNTNVLTINKYNNNVVVPSDENNSSSTIDPSILQKQRLGNLLQQRSLAYQNWLQTTQMKAPSDKIYAAWNHYGELDTAVHLAQLKLETTQKTTMLQSQKNAEAEKYQTNPRWVQDQIGSRTLSEFSYKRLVRELQSQGFQGQQLTQLTNEIVFEIRFGSLIKSKQTDEELSLDNAINIALKLVKERRWSTPTLLKRELAQVSNA